MRSIQATIDDLEQHFTVKNFEYGFLANITRGFADDKIVFPDQDFINFPPRAEASLSSDDSDGVFFPPRRRPHNTPHTSNRTEDSEQSDEEVHLARH